MRGLNSYHSSPNVRLSTKTELQAAGRVIKGILIRLTFSLFVKSLKDWDGDAQSRGSGYLFVV